MTTDKELAKWLWKRLDKCLPCDYWQHSQLVALAQDLTTAPLVVTES